MSVKLEYYTPSEAILSQTKNECYKSILSEIKKYKPNCQWIQLDENVQVQDLTLVRGGFYLGNYFSIPKSLPENVTFKSKTRAILGAVINPSLYAKKGKSKTKYFFSYYNMPESMRWQYLLWLAKEQSTEDTPQDVLFLYVFGIEVRLFIDQETTLEEKEILIRHLSELILELPIDSCLRGYVERVVDSALSLYFVHRIADFNLSQVFLNACGKVLFLEALSGAKSINAETALYLFERIYPNYFDESIKGTVYKYFKQKYRRIRVGENHYTDREEYAIPHDLYCFSYYTPEDLKYSIGVYETKVDMSRFYNLKDSYYALLRGFYQYDKISGIVKRQLSPFAYFTLPNYVQEEHKDALSEIIKKFDNVISLNNGLLSVPDFIDYWELTLQDCHVIHKRILDSLLYNMSLLDYGLIPNYNLGHKRLSTDAPCVIYKIVSGRPILNTPFINEREAFLKALSIVLRASSVSTLDYEFIDKCIRSIDESGCYQNHFRAFIIWLLQDKQTFDAKSKTILSSLPTESKQAYVNLLLLATSVSGNIDVKRVDALKKILPTFDVNADSVHIMLHHVLTDDMGFATVEKHDEAKEFTIRKPGPKKVKVELDQRKLDKFKEQTSIAQDLLSGIFVIEDDTDSAESSSLDNSMLSILKKLLEREMWTKEEVQQMCGPNVMIGNLLEQINDYAYEKVEDVVVDEDDDKIYIMTEYKDQLI